MKYEMINEELRIASCSLADLTLEQVKHFLGQWEPGSNIGNLILFYEKEDDVRAQKVAQVMQRLPLQKIRKEHRAIRMDPEKLNRDRNRKRNIQTKMLTGS